MATPQPIVLDGLDLEELMQYLLETHGLRSTLVVCSTKEVFLRQLQLAIDDERSQQDQEQEPTAEGTTGRTADPQPNVSTKKIPHPWSIPTLRLLSSTQTIRLAFCPNVTHLRAYLAAYSYHTPAKAGCGAGLELSNQSSSVLAVLNLCQLHRLTSSFSAQGLNRTMSVAVEAAHGTQSKLVLAECGMPEDETLHEVILPSDEQDTAGMPVSPPTSIWDTEVSILNVTTKSFGAGERGWVGRTVKVRTVAERWFVFEKKHRND